MIIVHSHEYDRKMRICVSGVCLIIGGIRISTGDEVILRFLDSESERNKQLFRKIPVKCEITNRTQLVRVGNHFSNPCPVSSGVPQGSVLGPILFILFINDVTDSFHDSIFAQLFADDIKIYTTLTHPADYTSFQNHLDLIHTWSSAWQLPISHSKCNVFEIGKRFQPLNNHTFNISSIPLISLQSTSDLGITMDNTLSFNNHIQGIIFRANQRSHLIH